MQLDGIIIKYFTRILKIGSVVNLVSPTVSDKEGIKEIWAEHFENMINRDWGKGKDIEENEKACDTMDVKEDLFCEQEFVTVLKGLKNDEAPGTDSVVNEFLKYGGYEIRNKLLKIMNVIFE